MIRFGVLGAGRIGKVHAGTIARLSNSSVAYVADAVEQAATDLAASVGAKVASVEEVLGSDVDAILICTPTDTHADLIEKAVQSGKHVLCEKPVSLSVERIEQAVPVVEKSGKAVMIGFNRRFDPNFGGLRKRLMDKEIGEVELVTIISRDPAPPPVSYIERSGGLFRDMMIHDFDMARFLVGEEFVTVHALGSALVDKAIGVAGDVDTASVQMQTASGKIAVITNSRRAAYGYDQRIEVHGSKGMLRAGNVHMSTLERADGAGFTADVIQNFFIDRYVAAYAAEVTAFVNAVESGTKPTPSIADGLAAQKLAEAATESRKTGQAVKVS
jgi:myo-inositol 2-dehydrogenase / D-chiro-inositol 1-dehydrogenase